MRLVVVISVSMLLAGCSGNGETPQSSIGAAPEVTSTSPSATTSARTSATTPTTGPATRPPAGDAPVSAVIAWVQGGAAADLAKFHTATRDDTTTDLGDGVAFVTPGGKTQCRADATLASGALACLVDLADPPAQPDDVYGRWVGNWVDFDGQGAQVGSVHGDPGPFTVGTGPELPYGHALRIGDYQCRPDPLALFCVNFARQTAVRMSDAGVVAFGCLQEVVPPPADAGIRYQCG